MNNNVVCIVLLMGMSLHAAMGVETQKYYRLKDETNPKTVSLALTSFWSASVPACATSCRLECCSAFSYDKQRKVCYLDPTLETSATPTSMLHFSAPSASQPTTFDLIEISTAELIETSTAELTETSTAELTETPTAELTETSTAELTETSTADLMDTSAAELLETSTAELTETSAAELIETSTAELTSTSDNSLECGGLTDFRRLPNITTCIRVHHDTLNTWQDASNTCSWTTPPTTLLRIPSYSKMDDILEAMQDPGMAENAKDLQYWVDATDVQSEGTFRWGDGIDVDTNLFKAGEPNNGNRQANSQGANVEDCLYLVLGTKELSDGQCSSTNYFICEYQIVN